MTPEERTKYKSEITDAFAKVSGKIVNVDESNAHVQAELGRNMTRAEELAFREDALEMQNRGFKGAKGGDAEVYQSGSSFYLNVSAVRTAFLEVADYTELSIEANRKVLKLTVAGIEKAADHREAVKNGTLKRIR